MWKCEARIESGIDRRGWRVNLYLRECFSLLLPLTLLSCRSFRKMKLLASRVHHRWTLIFFVLGIRHGLLMTVSPTRAHSPDSTLTQAPWRQMNCNLEIQHIFLMMKTLPRVWSQAEARWKGLIDVGRYARPDSVIIASSPSLWWSGGSDVNKFKSGLQYRTTPSAQRSVAARYNCLIRVSVFA